MDHDRAGGVAAHRVCQVYDLARARTVYELLYVRYPPAARFAAGRCDYRPARTDRDVAERYRIGIGLRLFPVHVLPRGIQPLGLCGADYGGFTLCLLVPARPGRIADRAVARVCDQRGAD